MMTRFLTVTRATDKLGSKLIFFGLLFCFSFLEGYSQDLRLKVFGNEKEGFHVAVFDGNQLLVENTGEFSLQLYNSDLSTYSEIKSWKGEKWTGNNNTITLTKKTYLKEFDTNLLIDVTYEVVNGFVIKKTIELFQPSIPSLYYILDQTAKPGETPQKYISFEYDGHPGGFVHEMYPSVGFVTNDNKVVGFLTDAGFSNHYTRTTRRRYSGRGGGFVGMRKLPDPALFSISTLEERAQDVHYIKQTFGEMYNLDAGNTIDLEPYSSYNKEGNVKVEEQNGLITIACKPSPKAGISFITPLKDQNVYTISFLCKGNSPLALKLFRVKNGDKTKELEHGIKYIDRFPTKKDEWTLFKGSILVPYIEKDSVEMFLGTLSGEDCEFQIKDLKIVEHRPQKEPYNVMRLGQKVKKTTYLFAEPWKTHHDFVISSQLRLAEGKGFEGSKIEKMLYANLNMHLWITAIDDFLPFNVPNMNYAPDMYNRDSFWSIIATYNRELNVSIWEQWGKTQTEEGAIGTIITPYMGSVEAKDNEATIEWLIWTLLNKRRFGVILPEQKIEKAVNYILNEFDEDRDGICSAHFSLSQVDLCEYNPKTSSLAVNQGMFAVALRTIKELGFDIDTEYIQNAENEYQKFYDPLRKHLLFDKNYPDIISFVDLIPEFLSLWLFDHPILTDEIVVNHLDQIPLLNKMPDSPHPEYGTIAPICVRLTDTEEGYTYLSSDYQPFGEFGLENYKEGKRDGFYYNGGSWLRAEYCAYVAGLKHGWEKARIQMENRAWAEINLHPDWAYSKEFIPTKETPADLWWDSTRGLCWNVFILMANELAGIRSPDYDPDYRALKIK